MQTTGTLTTPWLFDKENLHTDTSRRVEELGDLLRYRIPIRGLEATIESLRADAWELRMIVFDRHFSDITGDISNKLKKALEDFSDKKDGYTEALQHALTIYTTSVAAIIEKVNISKDFEFPADMDIPYTTLKQLSKLPHWSFRYLLQWVNSSLDLDTAMLTLYLHRQNPVAGLEKQHLIDLLRSSGERFGAYAEVLGFWNAPLHDSRQPIHNARILAAALRTEIAPGKKYDLESLQKQFAA